MKLPLGLVVIENILHYDGIIKLKLVENTKFFDKLSLHFSILSHFGTFWNRLLASFWHYFVDEETYLSINLAIVDNEKLFSRGAKSIMNEDRFATEHLSKVVCIMQPRAFKQGCIQQE